MTLRHKTRARLLGSAATSAALLFAVPGFAATGTIDIASLSAISNATLAITSPQDNTAPVTATTSIGGTPVVIALEAYTTTADDIATGTFGISGNSASASATGNTTATPNGNLLQISVLPTFDDSAAVTSLQTNTGAVSALSTDVDINAVLADGGATVHELQGTLSVDGNTVSTAGTANNAVNTIRVADSVSVVTAGGSPASVGSGGTANQSGVTADLLVNSVQNSATGDTSATTAGTIIDITVESADVSTVLLEDNRIAATARGNLSANTVDTGADAAILDLSVAVANYQRLNGSDATATVSGSTLAIAAGTSVGTFGVDNSTVGIDSNTSSASATANSTTQTLNLSANDVTGYALPVILSADGIATGAAVSVPGASAVISNAQDRTDSDAIATNTGGAVTLTATSGLTGFLGDSVIDSTLSVTTNMAEAVAVGNNASGSMLLDGNTVSGGAGIVSAQAGDAASTTTASVLANSVTLNAAVDLATSTAELTGNTQRAIAAGNIVSSALTVDTNEVNLVTVGGATVAVTDLGDATVISDFAVATLQSQLGNVTSEALNGGFSIIADSDVTAASTVANDANTRVAAAYGNDASSRITIDATVIAAAGPIGVAGAVSQQELNADVLARANGDSVVTTSVDQQVMDSSVSTSMNTVEALAMGNRTTTSSVMVDATTINTLSGLVSQPAFYDATSAVGQAAFNSVSAQVADGSVTASLRSGDNLDSSWIETYVGDDVSDSSITSELNTLRASATANAGVTGVALDATNVNTSSSVINAQVSSSDVSALLGVEGAGATLGGPFSYTEVLAAGYVYDGATSTVTSGTFEVDASALTAAEISYLTNTLGYAFSGGTIYTRDAAGTAATLPQMVTLTTTGTALNATVPASPGTPNEGGVTLTVLGDITDSTLSVLSNLTSGSVTGNAATNTTSVSGTNIGAGSATTIGEVDVNNASATADFALSNTQNLDGAGTNLQSEVFGTFAIATDLSISEDTDTSTIEIEGNTQAASATGNTATNTTSLAASNISTTAALTSVQDVADVDMDARSNLEVFAEVSDIQDSSVSVSANRNQSVAVTNDVTNTMTATGANVTTADTGLAASGDSNTVLGQADFALLGVQSSGGAVDSVAETFIYNQDLVSTATGNIDTSTVAFDSNVSIAEATANRGTNRMVLGDGATLTATGLVQADQVSNTVVTASVDSDVIVSVMSSAIGDPAATGSTLSVDGNASTAMARGNVGSNALTASATQITDPTNTTATASGNVVALVDASNIVLSYQEQTANVDANAVGGFGISLNDDTATAVATTDSSISVSGNLLSSMGVANVVTNSASLSGTTIDTTSAVYNGQLSAAALISADTDMTLSTVTTSTGSTIDMSSNSARAVAVANDATNSSIVSGTNVDFTGAAGNGSIDTVAGTGSSTHGVGNVQASNGTAVAATVSLNADNQESGFASTLGVATGTVSFDRNSALAEASSNRATNSLTLNGDASLAATGTVTNAQVNTATATANASTDLRLELDTGAAGAGPVISSSTASVDGNSTTALARGNVATNALNASSANISGSGASSTTLTGGTVQTVSATYGVLNAQDNGAIITAAVADTFYGMALNTSLSGGSDAVTNGTLSVAGNMVMAQATGNTGASSLTLTGLNSSTASAAIGSAQTNSGDVIASIASTTIGSSSFGSVTSSAVNVSGNTLSSSATGNSVTNLIRRD